MELTGFVKDEQEVLISTNSNEIKKIEKAAYVAFVHWNVSKVAQEKMKKKCF